MVLKKIDLETTPLTLDELLAQLDAETEVLLTRGDDPVARVAAVQPRVLGLHEGQGWMSEDFTDELFDSFWLNDADRSSVNSLGWSAGFFDRTYGALADDPIERPAELPADVSDGIE